MAINKSKDMGWKKYVELLAESPAKISEIEKIELSGYLLRRDLEQGKFYIFDQIIRQNNFEIGDLMASFLIAESPDTTFDFLQGIRSFAVEYYNSEINILISDEEKRIKEEKDSVNPNDEYDPNDNLC